MKSIILAFISAGLLLSGQSATAQSSPSTLPAPVGGGPSTAPIGHCRDIGARDPRMLLLAGLCESSQTYLQKLPDFVCQETTTAKGDPLEVVLNAQVTFVKGEEVHTQVNMNGRLLDDAGAATRSLMGFASDGEFGLFLANLFKAPIVANFRPAKDSYLNGSRASVYRFEVPAAKSFWRVRDSKSRVATPAFQGQIWIDQRTGQLLKLKLQSADLPPGLDVTWIRTSIDYAPSSLGDAGVFVLPVRSETTVCGWWENSHCPKHVMTFHDCHKFAATTRIIAEAPQP